MAQVIIHECDRCGQRTEHQLAVLSVSPPTSVDPRREPISFDLCSDCMGEALDWVGLTSGARVAA